MASSTLNMGHIYEALKYGKNEDGSGERKCSENYENLLEKDQLVHTKNPLAFFVNAY